MVLFLIFTVFSQYQWVFYLQLGHFISLQFIREIKWKKELCRESLFPCGKWDFSTRKKAFSRDSIFPCGKWDFSTRQKSKKAISLIILSKFEFFPYSRFQSCFSASLFRCKMKLSRLFYPLASLGNKIKSFKFHFPTQ